MTFENSVKNREIAVITQILCIFGTVESRQMRRLFDYLPDRQYGSILAKVRREGLAFQSPDGRYITTSAFAMAKGRVKDGILCFWAMIAFRDMITDICAGGPISKVELTSGNRDYSIIPVNEETKSLMNRPEYLPEEKTSRIFAVETLDDLDGIKIRSKNDYAVAVGPEGETAVYDLKKG